jgi:hypothetical protein
VERALSLEKVPQAEGRQEGPDASPLLPCTLGGTSWQGIVGRAVFWDMLQKARCVGSSFESKKRGGWHGSATLSENTTQEMAQVKDT